MARMITGPKAKARVVKMVGGPLDGKECSTRISAGCWTLPLAHQGKRGRYKMGQTHGNWEYV